ncbi:MAG: hypothetical protein J7K90_09075 [Desulfuromusa sp.]|nr:hypothetical protein [Desulfuromusa sp.]
MDLALQIWGGGFYLLNKIFLAFAEGKPESSKRTLRIIGWSVYLLGVPAWVIILTCKHNWIAASVEAGGIPAMLFGLYNVYKNGTQPNKSFDLITLICTYTFLVAGVCYSLYDYGGITSVVQILEIGIMLGFLGGSYLLAKKNLYGWIFFMLMNSSTATLMLIQNKPLLAIQQIISLGIVIYGLVVALRTSRKKHSQHKQQPNQKLNS